MPVVYTNPRFCVEEVDVEQGSVSRKHFFVKKKDAVLIVLTCEDKVLTIRNSRPLFSNVSCELPGGAIDPGETPLVAAYRELREETSIDEINLEPFGITVPLPSLVSESVFIFRGRLSTMPDLLITEEALAEGISKYEWIEIDKLDHFLSNGMVESSVDGYALSLLFMKEKKGDDGEYQF